MTTDEMRAEASRLESKKGAWSTALAVVALCQYVLRVGAEIIDKLEEIRCQGVDVEDEIEQLRKALAPR